DAGEVRNVAGRKDKRRLLAMQIGKFPLELDQRVIGSRNVARSTRADAEAYRGLRQSGEHLRVLSHSEIIVGAPHDDFRSTRQGMANCVRKPARDALKIGKHAVALFVLQSVQCCGEILVVIHTSSSDGTRWWQ